jgi:hypothetical protein
VHWIKSRKSSVESQDQDNQKRRVENRRLTQIRTCGLVSFRQI